jgi:hypothetical protein
MDFGCAAYCRFAAQCLGTDMPPELLAKRTDLLKDRLAAEVKKYLGRNFKRIARALKVVEYAGKIQKSEGGDPAIVILAAFLSAIAGGASGDDGSGMRFSLEDISAAESILARAGAPEELAGDALSILKNLDGSGQPDDSVNFKCVFDAIRIADLDIALKTAKPDSVRNWADELFLTQTGQTIMGQVLEESGVSS